MKTIRQALRQRARRVLAALFAEMSSLMSGHRNARWPAPSGVPQLRHRRRIDARPWPQVRRGRGAHRRNAPA